MAVAKKQDAGKTGRWTENGFQPTQKPEVKVVKVKKAPTKSDFDRLA